MQMARECVNSVMDAVLADFGRFVKIFPESSPQSAGFA
jgi:hypothetical protein